MHIKRFEAATLEAALARVKAELGPEALILSTRTLKKGSHGFGLLSRSTVEVQAALERPRRPAADERPTSGRPFEGPDPIASEAGAGADAAGLQRSIDELRHELMRLRRREPLEESLRRELRGLRETLDRRRTPDPVEAVDEAAATLARSGLEWRHALAIVAEWRARCEEEPGLTLERVLRKRIEERLAVPRTDGGETPRILIGAAGVGKTTTLAKLAARNEEGERDVAFVSLDGYRVGAQAQLQGYAELLESPHVEAASAAELPAIVSRFPRHSVLIDTAGRARATESRLEPLLDLRRALGRRASIELVIDASTRREVQDAQIERFAVLEPDRLIFSRVDECGSVVELANLLLDGRCPAVCWLATGQRVPEDLALVEPEIFSRPILGEAA